MTEPLGHEPTEDEYDQARAVANALNEAIRQAPNVSVGVAGASLFISNIFIQAVKHEYMLQAFDEWASSVRKNLQGEIRRAHN